MFPRVWSSQSLCEHLCAQVCTELVATAAAYDAQLILANWWALLHFIFNSNDGTCGASKSGVIDPVCKHWYFTVHEKMCLERKHYG